jgi:hypothetical protein
MLYCAVNSHFFFRAPSPRRNSTSNQIHASPQPASIQHLPHSHFPYIHNLLIPKHLRTLQKNTGVHPILPNLEPLSRRSDEHCGIFSALFHFPEAFPK